MKIEFLGPLNQVTGSCTWMHDDEHDWNFLVDCGIQQGEGRGDIWNNGVNWPFDPADIKFILLTHAHMDHCGLIPLLYKKGFKGKVLCTKETAEIAKVMLCDATKLGMPYTEQDIALIEWFEPRRNRSLLGGNLHPIDNDLFINFYRTSHIIGAVSIGIFWGKVGTPEQKKIIFSGDIGTSLENQENLPLLRHMMRPHEFDYAVIESTYGGKIRSQEIFTPEYRWQQLDEICQQITLQNSTALLPAFSLGRIQDLLFDMHWVLNSEPDKFANIELILDSPTTNKLAPIILEAIERTEVIGKDLRKVRPVWLGKQIFRWFELDDSIPEHIERVIDLIRLSLGEKAKYPEYAGKFGNQLARNWQSRVKVIRKQQDRQNLSKWCAKIIIASSGSCDGGAVTNWLPQVIDNSKHAVCFTGYSAPGSVAAELSHLGNIENDQRRRLLGSLKIPSTNTEIPYRDIACKIKSIDGYSAHADQTGLLHWLFHTFNGQERMTAPYIFIQHGDRYNRLDLKQAIECKAGKRKVNVCLPEHYKNQFEL